MNKFVKFSFVMAMVFSASINATAQKTDIVASWQGVNTLREVGGNHAPYKALASIYIKNDLKQRIMGSVLLIIFFVENLDVRE